jgi:hypothetical protein
LVFTLRPGVDHCVVAYVGFRESDDLAEVLTKAEEYVTEACG